MASSSPSSLAKPESFTGDPTTGLQKALTILEGFTATASTMTVSQASRIADLSRTTARRTLHALVAAGYLQSDGKRFWLTARALRIGDAYLQSARLPKIAQPIIDRLSYISGESATLGIGDGVDVIYIVRSAISEISSPSLRPGYRVPMYCTAGGRMLLSCMPKTMAIEVLNASTFRPNTTFTLLDSASILQLLPKITARGYSVVDQEFEIDMRSLSVPVRNSGGDVVGVISMSVRAEKLSVDRLVAEHLPRLIEAQSLLSGLL
jgi:IclR family pca regulon transcriptional regulator